MADGTPVFLITNLGLQVASVATPTGPYIGITSFQIGSAYGYVPQSTDTGINGNLLYQGAPTSFESIGNNTINIICDIPPDAGPFDFGEVALFINDSSGDSDIMFAKAVFDSPQTKFSSLGTNVTSSYTLNCLLSLQQSTAVFQITTNDGPPAVYDIYQWSDVFPSGVSANPDIPLYLVKELSPLGDSTILQNSSDDYWTVGTTYQIVDSAAEVVNSSTTWIEYAASVFHTEDLEAANRAWVIETADGFFRSVSSIAVSGANYRCNLNTSNDGTYNNSPLINAPSVGSMTKLYNYLQNGDRIYYDQIIDPPSIPLATNGVPGLMYAGQGLYMPVAGEAQAYGLLHSPSVNTGRVLTASDSLNNTAFNSGVYATQSSVYGFPAAMPVAWDGTIIIQAQVSIIQTYYPGGTGGGDGLGNGGYPIYFRSWISSSWSSWFPISINNKLGSDYTLAAVGEVTGTYNGTNSTTQNAFYYISGGNWSGGSGDERTNPFQLVAYVNGVNVGQTLDNDGDDHRVGFLTIPVPAGGSITITSTPFSAPGSGTYSVYVLSAS